MPKIPQKVTMFIVSKYGKGEWESVSRIVSHAAQAALQAWGNIWAMTISPQRTIKTGSTEAEVKADGFSLLISINIVHQAACGSFKSEFRARQSMTQFF